MLSHIFDTHSHYDDRRFDADRDGLISSLFANGMSGIIHAATDLASSEFGIEQSRKYERYYASVGIHPENADSVASGYIDSLRLLAQSEKVVAIGEIGLDYHYEGYDKASQIELFTSSVELANELSLPVIIHCRDAVGDCMEILKRLKPKGVMHCYSGSPETARELLELGMYIGFTGAITFKNAKKAAEVLKILPLDRLLLETDCPYMAPEPLRGKRCDSAMIRFTAQRAAEIMGVESDELLAATEENAVRVFGIE